MKLIEKVLKYNFNLVFKQTHTISVLVGNNFNNHQGEYLNSPADMKSKRCNITKKKKYFKVMHALGFGENSVFSRRILIYTPTVSA